MSSDQAPIESGTVSEARAAETGTEEGPDWLLVNWGVIAVFTVLTLGGMVIAVRSTVAVPPFVYLYSGLGALGYIFTKLMADLDRYMEWSELEQLVEMAMRIPAAWILATGIYLFLANFGQADGAISDRFAAGVVFLVGLYVNVAMKALGSLADRILGRSGTE